MKKLLHISDLHFGKINQHAAESLIETAGNINPDVVVISGDITQRARKKQFIEGAAFLKRIDKPKVIIPGNHDIPLFDIFRRFFLPLHRYKKYITDDLSPYYEDNEIIIFGINTARSFTWKNGRISLEQISDMERVLCPITGKLEIVVTHHPFIPPPGDAGISLVGRSVKALRIIDKCNVDLLLAGHLHEGYSGDVRSFYPGRERSVISVQAGTAISSRVRAQPNAFNIISIVNNKIKIEISVFNGKSFEPSSELTYIKENGFWKSD